MFYNVKILLWASTEKNLYVILKNSKFSCIDTPLPSSWWYRKIAGFICFQLFHIQKSEQMSRLELAGGFRIQVSIF